MPQVRGSPIRYWIGKAPHPTALVAWDDDGRETRVAVGKGATKWADAEAAVLDAVKIHALDASGAVIRVYKRPEVEGGAEPPSGELGEARALLAMLPKMFEGLGRSMADMADRACSRQQEAFGKAFDALTNVVKAQSDAFTSGMQQNRELQGELTALTRQLREEMLDAAEGEANAIRESANGSSEGDGADMKALTELAVKVAGPAIVQHMMAGDGEKKAS